MNQALGIDLVSVPRLRAMVLRWGDRLLERLFTADERAASSGARGLRWDSLAGRFAAKEAAKKVLASQGHIMGWNEIEVHNGSHGEPLLRLHGRARAAAQYCGYDGFVVSISHERDMAVAVVIAVPRIA